MALEYDFYLDGDMADDALNPEIEKISANNEKSGDRAPLRAATFDVSPFMEATILAHFGFTPRTGVTFTMDKFAKPGVAGEKLILTSMALLQNEKVSNAALLFGGEVPIFHYANKILFLNESRGYWTSKKTSLLAIPFHFKNIPIL